MSKLLYRTIADERPQGKPNVYFSCHPDDLGKYFEEKTIRILGIQDCAIWYESEPEADYDIEELEMNLSQMQLIVIPVTTKLLTSTCRTFWSWSRIISSWARIYSSTVLGALPQ